MVPFYCNAILTSGAVKLPFPLTMGFKSMLQRGIETQDMDARWVSSLSWYFLNFFGLNGLYRLILGGDNGEWCLKQSIWVLNIPHSCGLVTRHDGQCICCGACRCAGLQQVVQSRKRQFRVLRRVIFVGRRGCR